MLEEGVLGMEGDGCPAGRAMEAPPKPNLDVFTGWEDVCRASALGTFETPLRRRSIAA